MIKIIDNFFNEDMLKKIQQHITTNLSFMPRYFEGKKHTKSNYFGMRFKLNQDSKLLKTFVLQTEKKFKIKIKKINDDSGIDIRNLENFSPHVDSMTEGHSNILIMLKGPTAITNGTVFYTDGKLDMHVGFKENRALMFPSNIYHSAHASNIPNLKRYTASLLTINYEEE